MRALAINLAIFVLILASLEVGFRLLGPDYRPAGTDSALVEDNRFGRSPGLAPGAIGRSHGTLIEVDDSGFIHYSAHSEEPATTWLLIGDSVTMGLGVAPDSTFAGRLAQTHPNTRMLNPSLIGYSLADYERVVTHILKRVAVDEVLVLWCLNDVFPEASRVLEPGWELRDTYAFLLRTLGRYSMAYHGIKDLFLDRSASYYHHAATYYTPRALADVADRLSTLQRAVEQTGARLTVMVIPFEFQLRTGDFTKSMQLMEALARKDVPSVDARSFLQASKGPWFLPGDGIHLNPAGHAAVAAGITAWSSTHLSG